MPQYNSDSETLVELVSHHRAVLADLENSIRDFHLLLGSGDADRPTAWLLRLLLESSAEAERLVKTGNAAIEQIEQMGMSRRVL